MILGIDISTSITGFAIIKNDKLVYNQSCDLRKYKNVFDKADKIKEQIQSLSEIFESIEKIYIEQPFMFFNSGGSSAKTMASLQRFNGIVSWMCYEIFNLKPEYVTASKARKEVGIVVARGQKAKQVVMKFLLDNEPEFVIEYTAKGNPRPEAFDRADAIVVARAGYLIEQTRSKKDTS